MKLPKWAKLAISIITLVVMVVSIYIYTTRTVVSASQDYVSISLSTRSEYAIVYPPTVTTDTDKLAAVVNLLEQMRIEHNKQGAIALSDWKKYEAQWITYKDIFDAKVQPLLDEKARLLDALVFANKSLDTKEKQATSLDSIYLNAAIWQITPTTTTYSGLDSLKKVSVDSVVPGKVVDPYEDYTTYTEVDPSNWYTVATNNITFVNALDNAASYIYKDFGANHFNAISEYFQCSINSTNPNGDQTSSSFTVSQVGDYSGRGTSDMSFMMRASLKRFVLVRGERTAYDYWDGNWDAVYYNWIQRVTDNSTITCKIYDNPTRTNLLKTLSVTGYGTTTKYRYHYGAASWNGGGGSGSQFNGYMANDDLNEAAAISIVNAPSSKAFGVVQPNSTYYAKGSAPSNPVTDGECSFTIINDGSSSANITIKETNPTGGVGWTLTSGAPGSNTIRDTAYAAGTDPASGVVLTTVEQSFITNLASSGTKKWDFKRETGTFTDGVAKSSTITLTASAS